MTTALAFPGLRRWAALLAFATTLIALPLLAADTVYLEIDPDGLEDLGRGWAYEGWLMVDGSPVSTGTFTVDAGGAATPSRARVEVASATAVTAYVLTIEPVPDLDPGPSTVHVLAGDFVGATAHLRAGHAAALGDDFAAAAGSYILAAPSAGGMAPYGNGIWWLDPSAGPGPTLELPTLPDGWTYEGWVVGPDGPVSTGAFVDPAGADRDGPGIGAGPYAAPPFPGQDFVTPGRDLRLGHAAVVSIEPVPDTSPAPFAFKPLVDAMVDDLGEGVPQAMANHASTFPTAVVTMTTAAAGETAHLMLDLSDLDDLGDGAAYEGWLVVDGAPVSTGVFTVAGGVQSETYFPTTVASLDAISAFVLTIEPVPDDDPAPSPVHLLAGDLVGGRAALTVAHPAALGTDFADAAGRYLLAAPSAGGSASYVNGIWWLDPAAGPGPTLELPTLPEGWVYEGWVASADGPISTGRFTAAVGADHDGAGPGAGPDATPPFPGQDFVNPPLDLTDGFAAVISVEPEPDNSPAPFTLKPLLDPLVDDVGEGLLQPMHRNPAALPSGVAALANVAVVPAAASAAGVDGARWESDLDLVNDGDASAVLIQLLRSGQANPAPSTVRLSLPAAGAVHVVDAVAALFEHEGSGALRLLASSHQVRAASRTYAVGEAGSYGQGIPSFALDQALAFGDSGRLVGLAGGERFRANVGFVNATDLAVDVHLELFGADGSTIETMIVALMGGEHRQLNGVVPAEVDLAWARVWTSTPGGRFFAYASVVDNGVDDPTFITVR